MADNDPAPQPASPERLAKTQAVVGPYQVEEKALARLSAFKKNEASKRIKEIENEKKKILDMYNAQDLSFKEYQKLLNKANREQDQARTAASTKFSRAMDEAGDILSNLSKKFGIDVQNASAIGWAIWTLSLLDSQRVMSNWAKTTVQLFGGASSAGAKQFSDDFNASFKSTLKSARFVTDQARTEFFKTAYQLGLQIRKTGGAEYLAIANDLIKVGQAFGYSAGEMANKLFYFQDVFKTTFTTTQKAAKGIEDVIGYSLKLGVAPSRFLGLVENLTNQFKLEKIAIEDVAGVYQRYFQGLHTGVLVTEELTQKTVAALGSMSEGKIAALLALTQNLAGKDLGKMVVDFYTSGDTKSRLILVQDALMKLNSTFKGTMQNEFAGVKLVMQTFGIQDFAVGSRLYKALQQNIAVGGKGVDVSAAANQILGDTQSFSEQALGTISNILSFSSKGLMMLLDMIKRIAFKGESDVDKQFDSLRQQQAALQKLNQATLTGDSVAKAEAQAILDGMREADENTSNQLNDLNLGTKRTATVLTDLTSMSAQQVQEMQKSNSTQLAQLGYAQIVAKAQAVIEAAKGGAAGIAAAAAQAAIMGTKAGQLVAGGMAMAGVVVSMSDTAKKYLEVSKTTAQQSITSNVPNTGTVRVS